MIENKDHLTINEKNRKIAKNTVLLYFRMFFTLGVSLYTSRIILNTLGVIDFGIYNLVGGFVILFSFLNTAMSSATQRFLNYELGKNNNENVNRIFSMSMTIHLSIALFVLIITETVGLWIFNTRLNIPPERIYAANWVYQFSIITFCIQIIRVPYTASIIAYEKMSFYAYISIFEVILKLIVILALINSTFDKLIVYAFLVCSTMFFIQIIYKRYCIKNFTTCKYSFFWEASLYKKLLSFSGWSLFGSIANVSVQQSLSILLNIFYGVAINAAIGIANQVSNAINGFVSNFQIAFSPQLIKSYATNEQDYFINLIFKTSKYSYYLLFLLSLPILTNTDFILKIWLTNVPDYSVSFCKLIILSLLIDSLAGPLWISVQSTGKIKHYQIFTGIIIILNIPLSYLLIKYKYIPESVLLLQLILNFIAFIFKIIYLKININLPVKRYLNEVILNVTLVTFLACIFPVFLKDVITWQVFVFKSLITILSTLLFIYIIGLTKYEKSVINSIIIDKIKR